MFHRMAKQFISKININLSKQRGNEMMIVTIGYTDYVLPVDKAITLLGIFEKMERYENRYISKDHKSNTTGEAFNTYHVYPSDTQVVAKMLSDEAYQMAKLAGKPIQS